MAIAKNPNIFLGVPNENYFLIDLLIEKLHTALNILITSKKMVLMNQLLLWLYKSELKISRIFQKSLIQLA